MKEIQLHGFSAIGKTALVDDEDFDYLNQFSWNLIGAGYVSRVKDGRLMHNVIMGCTGIDHKDRNKQNNQRSNLRLATRSQNKANSSRHSNNTTGFKGVSFHKLTGQFMAYIGVNNKLVHLGLFRTRTEAALAYNKAAVEHFGEFAKLNNV